MLDPVIALDRMPRWMRTAALSVTRGQGALGAVYDRIVHRFDSTEIPAVPPTSSAATRVLLGPANEAEQGYQWIRAFERFNDDLSGVAMTGIDPARYRVKTDLYVPTPVYLRSSEWHASFETYLDSLTHVIFESGLPLLGRRYGSDPFVEANRLESKGVGTAMIFHGSDIRSPAQHARESEWSPFVRAGLPVTLMEEKAEHTRSKAVASGMPLFVSTPDLLRHAPGSVWCPIVVDPVEWRVERSAWPSSRRPVVVHAPSHPLLKGSDEIEPALRRMETEGLIEYRVIRGVPYSEMPQRYAEADIVLDHFLIGNYSMVTIEALAAGCLVIGHVDQNSREAVLDSSGLEVPVLEATVLTLEAVLRQAIRGGDVIDDLLARGPSFVEQVHNGRHSAAAVSGFLRPRQ